MTLVENKLRVKELNEEAYSTRGFSVSKSIELAGKALQIAEKLNFSRGIADSKLNLALFYMIKGRNEEAISYAEDARLYYEKKGLNQETASALYVVGSVHYKTANHHLGLDFLYQALQKVKKSDNRFLESKILKAIAYIFEVFEEHERALNIYNRCIKISQDIKDYAGEANALNPVSSIYLRKGDLSNSKKAVERSIQLSKKTKDLRCEAFALHGLGKIYFRESNFKKAESIFRQSLEIHRKQGEKLGESMSLLVLTKLFLKQGNYPKAREFGKKSIDLGNSMKNNDVLFKARKYLYLADKEEGNVEGALKNHEAYLKHLEFSLRSEARSKTKSLELIYKNDLLEKEAIIQKKNYETLVDKNKIIEEKNLELDTLNNQLTEAIDAKNKFFTIIAHDIKNPLNALIGLTNLLKDYYNGMDEEERKLMISKVNESSIGLLKLTQNLLDWSRIQLNRIPIQPERLNLNKLISESVSLLETQAASKNISLENLVPDDQFCHADQNMLSTVIRNLVSNSIKFTNKGGFARISSKLEDDLIRIQLEDNGIGISENDLKKIFAMEEKYLIRGTDNESGTGLGLLICKEFIEKNGGTIEAKSELSKGTTFTFTLPVDRSR